MRKYASDTLFISRVIQKAKRINARLGNHRYSIIAFVAGGALEFCMVKLKVNGANYYKSFIDREASKEAEKIFWGKRNKELVEDLLKNTPQEALDSVEFKNFDEEIQKRLQILEEKAAKEDEEKKKSKAL